MQKRSSFLWVFILLLSIAWMAGGAFITSDVFDGGNVGSEVRQGIKSLASDANVDVPAEIPLPLVFVATGLPLAAISLLFLWRAQRTPSASAASPAEPRLRRQTIIVTVLALIFALVLWNIHDIERALRQSGAADLGAVDELSVSIISYPVRLFVTFVHEAGHSLAALLSGGQVRGFTVSPDGTGYAQVSGNLALILPAGYLGAALFGATLFFLTNRVPRWTQGLSFLMGLAIVVLTLSYAMPDDERNATALIVGISFGVGLIALGWFAPRIITLFLLNTLAILTGLNAVFDLWLLVRNSDAGTGSAVNDAARFSSEVTPLLPAGVVAFMWAAIAVAMLAFAVYFGLIKQVGGELKEVVKGKT